MYSKGVRTMENLDDEGCIRVEEQGALILIGIDRRAKRNSFTPKMFDQLSVAYQRFEDSSDARVAVLYACGDHFSAGLQLDLFETQLRAGQPLARSTGVDPFQLRPPYRSKPCVVAMQGICYTVAIELMLAADVVVAASDCRFAQLEVRRGIMANHGATMRRVERAGWGSAMRILLSGEEFDAEAALRLGLVREVTSPGRQLGVAIDIAERIAKCAPLAVAATIASARLFLANGFDAAAAVLASTQAELLKSDDAAEGLRSFRERRGAVFKGR
jgi:enoyl-CoA hydratase